MLSSCGFHLRGMIDVPTWLDNIAILSKEGNRNLISRLTMQLESYRIRVNPDPTTANYLLIIDHYNVQQQIVSIGSSTNPRQYQLIMSTEFSLQTPKGQIIKPPGIVTVSRQLTVNNDRILGSNDEASIMITEMHNETAIQIINRLSRN